MRVCASERSRGRLPPAGYNSTTSNNRGDGIRRRSNLILSYQACPVPPHVGHCELVLRLPPVILSKLPLLPPVIDSNFPVPRQ